MLYGDRDETIKHIIRKCCQLEQNFDETRLSGKGHPLRIVQDIGIRPNKQMVFA